MEQNKVSIIIPVYNAANSLVRCVHSVMEQTYNNIEIVLVDDGSTDDSNKICCELAKGDPRIKVIYQENQGVSSARNKGIENADGVYIQFVDSDDYIQPNMTENLVALLETNNAELGICGYRYVNNQNGKIEPFIKDYNIYPTRALTIKKFIKHLGYYLIYFNNICSPWNKMYRTDLIKIHKLLFQKDIEYGEDLVFNISYLYFCQKVIVSNELLYNYVIDNINSLEGKYKDDLFAIQLEQNRKLRELMEFYGVYGEYNRRNLSSYCLERIIYCIRMLYHKDCKMNETQRLSYITNMLDNESVQYAAKHRAFDLNGSMVFIPELILTKKYVKLQKVFYDHFVGNLVDTADYNVAVSSFYVKIKRRVFMFAEMKAIYGFALALTKTFRKYKCKIEGMK